MLMIGKRIWSIPEGYIPEDRTDPEPELSSSEIVRVLNPTEEDASVEITVYFSDREPIGPYEQTVPAERTRQFRFSEFEDPEPVPTGKPFASVIESDVPIVCQHTRLDSRQDEHTVLTTIAHPGE